MVTVRKLSRGIVLAAGLTATIVWAGTPHDEKVRKDLFAVIALQGHPCGEVISVQPLDAQDYLATCRTGERYRVRVDADGRVRVEPQ
jgi:hypothetical protein